MKSQDLGFDPITNRHTRTLTIAESRFLGILWLDHVGKENKIPANFLAVRFDYAMEGKVIDTQDFAYLFSIILNSKKSWLDRVKRDVRFMQTHLIIAHDIPVLSKAGIGGGYWISDDKSEALEFYDTFKRRGLTGIIKASRGKKSVLVAAVNQLSFEFEELATAAGLDVPAGDPAAIDVVDSFLGKMLANPERFSGGLRMLSKKYGSVLLDMSQLTEIKEKAAELSRLVERRLKV